MSTRLNPCFNGRYSQSIARCCKWNKQFVLILVLMEDTLRGIGCKDSRITGDLVLILVLMEDTLREPLRHLLRRTKTNVLILVLMEDTLRDNKDLVCYIENNSLNPCFNGRYSQRVLRKPQSISTLS